MTMHTLTLSTEHLHDLLTAVESEMDATYNDVKQLDPQSEEWTEANHTIFSLGQVHRKIRLLLDAA